MNDLLFFTGQQQIARSAVSLDCYPGPDGTIYCAGAVKGLPTDLPRDSRFILEAYKTNYLYRHEEPLRACDVLLPPIKLPGLTSARGLLFRVKVAHRDAEGLPVLSAVRDQIRPASEEERGESVLLVTPKTNEEMRSELWKIGISETSNGEFELLINKDAGSLQSDLDGQSITLMGLIVPAAIRDVLRRVLRNEADDVSEAFKKRWLEMGESVLAVPPPRDDVDDDFKVKAIDSYIDHFVEALCLRHRFAEQYLGLRRHGDREEPR